MDDINTFLAGIFAVHQADLPEDAKCAALIAYLEEYSREDVENSTSAKPSDKA